MLECTFFFFAAVSGMGHPIFYYFILLYKCSSIHSTVNVIIFLSLLVYKFRCAQLFLLFYTAQPPAGSLLLQWVKKCFFFSLFFFCVCVCAWVMLPGLDIYSLASVKQKILPVPCTRLRQKSYFQNLLAH